MMAIGAWTALGIAMVSVTTGEAAALEQTRDTVQQRPLVNRENPRSWRRTPRSMIVSGSGNTISRNGAVHRSDILLSGRHCVCGTPPFADCPR
jgi:hypothetical protein